MELELKKKMLEATIDYYTFQRDNDKVQFESVFSTRIVVICKETPSLHTHKIPKYADMQKLYKKLARIHHPDKGGDQVIFQKIVECYNNNDLAGLECIDKNITDLELVKECQCLEKQVETLESSAWYLWRYDRRQFDNHYMDKQTSIKRCDILRDNIKIAQSNILYIKSYIEPGYYRDVRLPELEKDVLRYSDQLENIIKSLKNVFDYSYDRE